MRAILLLLCLCLAGVQAQDAKDKPKPEIKERSHLWVRVGQTATVVLYGENLAPKEVTVGKGPLTAKLLGVMASESDEDKKRGSRQVSVEVTAPADCPPDLYELTLVHEDDAKVSAPLAVVEVAAAEHPVKRPNATFAQAMPLEGGSVAVTGALGNDTPDLFRFDAKAGETWEITLLAGRAGSPLDALVRLRDARYFPLALAGGDPKQDRRLAFRAPADGTYYIELSDAEGRGGPTYQYRLTLRRAEPAP